MGVLQRYKVANSPNKPYGIRMIRFCLAVCTVLLWFHPALGEPIARNRLKIVDGDSVRVDGKLMRLRDCDTPEIKEARCDVERERGEVAASPNS